MNDHMSVHLAGRTWQGIPGIERTARGRIFVSWFTGGPKEPAPENTVLLSFSDDDGRTFSEPTAVAPAWNDGTRCFDPALWIDPEGRLWYLFNRGNKDTARHDVRACICDEPDAASPAFGPEFRIDLQTPYAFRLNKPTVLSSGEWVMPVTHAAEPIHEWSAGDKQLQGVAISRDMGVTWSLHGAVRAPEWALECMVIELGDGRLRMLIRTGGGVLWESYSDDRGVSWGEGRPSAIENPGSRFFIRRLDSGNLLLVNHYRFTGRSHLTARLSTDDGATWNDGLLLDERRDVSYPDGVQDGDGLIRVTYDRDRQGAGEILMATFREEDAGEGRDVSGAVHLKQIVNKLDNPGLLKPGWDPVWTANRVMDGLIRVTPPRVRGAHDAEFVCVGDRAYIVATANDLRPGHSDTLLESYCALSIFNLNTLSLEAFIPFARSDQVYENAQLPEGQCFVPRILEKDESTLRCYFTSQNTGVYEEQIWHIDFDVASGAFVPRIFRAKLKTASGVHDMGPGAFYADAAANGFRKPPLDYGMYIFDSFKRFGGKTYVALNNFPGKQNALAVLHDDFETFEVIGHYNEPQGQQLSESAVNRLPDGTWMAICRNDAGNYHFTTSKDGRIWAAGREMPHVKHGENSKPTFDRFGGFYYLGWQDATRVGGCRRSVFNLDVSRDGRHWERKYRFETPESFQYPTFHEHEGVIWLSVTQSDHQGSTDRIMFGMLEELE